MNDNISMQALFVGKHCGDEQTFRELFRELNVRVFVSHSPDDADALLACKKFDAAVLDCETFDETCKVFEQLSRSRSSSKAVVFVIARGPSGLQHFWRAPAQFVLNHPLDRERVARTLRIAYGLMLRERRRYYRHTADITAQATLAADGIFEIRLLNISEGGVAVHSSQPLNPGEPILLKFRLPESDAIIRAEGKVLWADESGRAGVMFCDMKTKDRRNLVGWLAELFYKNIELPTSLQTIDAGNAQP